MHIAQIVSVIHWELQTMSVQFTIHNQIFIIYKNLLEV